MLKNALTIDVEDWFHATYLGVAEENWPSCEPWVKSNIHRILGILKSAIKSSKKSEIELCLHSVILLKVKLFGH